MREYALVPLKNTVIFPRMRTNLTILRPRAIQAITEAWAQSRTVMVAKQHDVEVEDPMPGDMHTIGTVVQILDCEQDGASLQVQVEGLRRVRIEEWVATEPYARVLTARVTEPAGTSPSAQALVRNAHEIFDRYIELNRRFTAQEIDSIKMLRSASRLADVLAAHLVSDPDRQQDLLATIDPEQRLEKICVMLGNAIEVLDLDQRIRQRVRDQVDRNQQEYYLKEQLRAIQRELGQDAANEAQELRDRVGQKGMPPDVATKVLKEIAKLERSPANSAETGVIRNYIDWMLALPWQDRSEDRLDIAEVERVLDEGQYGLERVKDRITDFLAVRQLKRSKAQTTQNDADRAFANKGPILCLIGPPGVGKTSLGESIAKAMGRTFVRISLGGVHDEAEIRGHRRTYVGALPGRIINAMKTAGVKNPVFLLDEIDKLASDYRGDPAAALLEVLDPGQNGTYTDHYLEVPFDLSEVFFICTGNNRYGIPRPLADRLEIIDIPGYTEEEKLIIGRGYIWPKVLREHALVAAQVKLPDKVLAWIISSYTREAGVRSLERTLAAICRKVARRMIREPEAHLRLTKKTVEEYLGSPRYSIEQIAEDDQVGLAMGMAWTEVGGTLLPVEVAFMPGHGDVRLTGQQGDVMRESAQTAHSYIRTRAEQLGISPSFADQQDLHLHLPEGAVPKDGPSAGITIATAMISALTFRPVRADTAMTGEITLRGRVLPIGGLRDKVLAAYRAGIRRIILPADNKKDIAEIPEAIRDKLEFIPVSRMEEVEEAALLPRGAESDGPPSATLVTQGSDSGIFPIPPDNQDDPMTELPPAAAPEDEPPAQWEHSAQQ
jgi:ATP-dependent Lon protease